MKDGELWSEIVKETLWSETPWYKILHWCRDTLSSALSYVWWKFVKEYTKFLENSQMICNTQTITRERIREKRDSDVETRIHTYWGEYSGDDEKKRKEIYGNGYFYTAIQRYNSEVQAAKEKRSNAIREINSWIREELRLLKYSLINNEKGENTTD